MMGTCCRIPPHQQACLAIKSLGIGVSMEKQMTLEYWQEQTKKAEEERDVWKSKYLELKKLLNNEVREIKGLNPKQDVIEVVKKLEVQAGVIDKEPRRGLYARCLKDDESVIRRVWVCEDITLLPLFDKYSFESGRETRTFSKKTAIFASDKIPQKARRIGVPKNTSKIEVYAEKGDKAQQRL